MNKNGKYNGESSILRNTLQEYANRIVLIAKEDGQNVLSALFAIGWSYFHLYPEYN